MARKIDSLNMPSERRVCGAAETSTSTFGTICGSPSSECSSATNAGFGSGFGSTPRIVMWKP